MKTLMTNLLALAILGASHAYAAAPAPALTPAQQAVALQLQGETEFSKGTTGTEKWARYNAWRAANDDAVFALALPIIDQVAALNKGVAVLIVRNYAGALARAVDPIAPLDGIADIVTLARTYAPGVFIQRFATADELAAIPVTAANQYNFVVAARRLGDPAIAENARKAALGKGVMETTYQRWFSAYVASLPVDKAIAIVKAESRAIDARPAGPARDAWLEKLMTTLSVCERVK
jgi:hypothetical protein